MIRYCASFGADDLVRLPDHDPEPHAELAFVGHLLHRRRSWRSGEPASSNVVMPLDNASSSRARGAGARAPQLSAGVGLPAPRDQPCSASRAAGRSARRSGPSGSRRRPGSWYCASIPAACIACAFTKAHDRSRGSAHRVVRRHLVERRVRRETLDVRAPAWRSISPGASRVPRIHSPGFAALAASPTIATMSSQDLALRQVELMLAFRRRR